MNTLTLTTHPGEEEELGKKAKLLKSLFFFSLLHRLKAQRKGVYRVSIARRISLLSSLLGCIVVREGCGTVYGVFNNAFKKNKEKVA